MKFNLKNRPERLKQWKPEEVHNSLVKETIEWFEGFEKELRQMKVSGVYETHFDRRLIEEILGE